MAGPVYNAWRRAGVVVLLGGLQQVSAGLPVMKWIYPAPRTSQSDLTTGPCGNVDDESRILTTLSPGWTTVSFHETFNASNTYIGGNFRIGLSGIGINDAREIDTNPQDCVLLDHIPSQDESEAYNYTINIQVPNVQCERCTLQLLYVVPRAGNPTCDFSDERSLPGGVPAPDDCQDVFFSCAYVKITGIVPAGEATCDIDRIQGEWPLQPGESMLCDDDEDGACEDIPERNSFRYSKCRGNWEDTSDEDHEGNFAFLEQTQRADGGVRHTIDSIFRTQQFKGFNTGDVPRVGASMDKEEQPVDKTAAGVSVAAIFAVASIFILFIHLQTHGNPSCHWLNEGGLPPGKAGHMRAESDYSKMTAAKSPLGAAAAKGKAAKTGAAAPPPPPPPRKNLV